VAHAGTSAVGIEGREPVPRLPAEIEISLFRIAQEALNNASRHAQALHVRISLCQDAGSVTLAIRDDGRGFDNSAHPSGSGSLGLITMRERADAMNGRFVIEALDGTGTNIRVTVPHMATMAPAL
jgi:signal transduction histidine kinase